MRLERSRSEPPAREVQRRSPSPPPRPRRARGQAILERGIAQQERQQLRRLR